ASCGWNTAQGYFQHALRLNALEARTEECVIILFKSHYRCHQIRNFSVTNMRKLPSPTSSRQHFFNSSGQVYQRSSEYTSFFPTFIIFIDKNMLVRAFALLGPKEQILACFVTGRFLSM